MSARDLVAIIQKQSHFTVSPTTEAWSWSHLMYSTYSKWILSPLARLYLWGPTLGGWGFWGGMEMADICAQKTTLAAEFWKHHPEQCVHLVTKQFYSVTVLVETLTYFYGVYFLYKYILLRLISRVFHKPKKTAKPIKPL